MRTILSLIEKKFERPFTIRHWLLVSSMFSMTLLLVRILMTGYITYAFLAWNLFLAFVPYYISGWVADHMGSKNKWKLLPAIGCWLLFMPNTFYIITDLFHLDDMADGHQWFDLTMILSFAWNGILFGMLSIRKMEMILGKTKGKLVSGFVICFVMWLNAFGIYIGRFLRFNSWDVIANPFSLFGEIFSIVFNPYEHRWVWAMTACFSFFMLILYYTMKRSGEIFHHHKN
jgi:uncharacterized membrane protein